MRELRDIEIGIGVTHSDRSYDLALVTKFNNVEWIEAYQINPVHVDVSKYYMVFVSVSNSNCEF
ncbi:Dabb family protein [Methanobacterium sp.]|uniref:Dabb family protein n=1 Tax=Methanobacterium sp. TaxID=2164 RepID=UPI003C713018